MRAKPREIAEGLRKRMHEPIVEQGRWLGQVVRGYFADHAVPANAASLAAFLYYVKWAWRLTLRRRSQNDPMTWA